VTVNQVQLGIVDLGIVSAYQPFLLSHHRLLRVVLLLCDYSLFIEIGIALQIALSVFEICLVFVSGRLCLSKLDLIRPWVNQRKFITFSNVLTFPKMNLHQLPVNPAVTGNGVIGLNVPKTFEVYRNVALLHWRN